MGGGHQEVKKIQVGYFRKSGGYMWRTSGSQEDIYGLLHHQFKAVRVYSWMDFRKSGYQEVRRIHGLLHHPLEAAPHESFFLGTEEDGEVK